MDRLNRMGMVHKITRAINLNFNARSETLKLSIVSSLQCQSTSQFKIEEDEANKAPITLRLSARYSLLASCYVKSHKLSSLLRA